MGPAPGAGAPAVAAVDPQGLPPAAAVEGGPQGAPREGPRDPPAVGRRAQSVVPERGRGCRRGRRPSPGRPPRRPSVRAGPRPRSRRAGGPTSPVRARRTRAASPGERRGDRHRHERRHRGEDGRALESGPWGAPESAPCAGCRRARSVAGLRRKRRAGLSRSPGGAPRRTPRSGPGERPPAPSRGRRAPDLAADRGHAPQQARRHGGAAGDREEPRGAREWRSGSPPRPAGWWWPRSRTCWPVLHPEAGELQPHEVEDVGDDGVGRQDACAAGQGGGALGGQRLGLFDPGWTMVAANAAREQWLAPL